MGRRVERRSSCGRGAARSAAAAIVAAGLLGAAPGAVADGPGRAAGNAGAVAAPGVRPRDERPPAAAIPFKRDEPQGSSGGTPGVVATLVGLALLAGALALGRRAGWFARRRPGDAQGGLGAWLASRSGDRPLAQRQVLRLTPRASLHLIRWGERELLVACSEAGVTLLDRSSSVPGAGPPAMGGASVDRPAGTAEGER